MEKLQVCSVRLIHDQHFARIVSDLRDAADVAADPVIVRTRQYHRFSLGILSDAALDLLRRYSSQYPVLLYQLRLRVHRPDSAQRQRIEH